MLTNLKLAPGDAAVGVAWTIATRQGNSITVKWRSSSTTPWSAAPRIELPYTATGCTITGLVDKQSYEIQVSQTQFYPSPLSGKATPVAKRRFAICNDSGTFWIPAVAADALSAGLTWDRIDVGDGTSLTRLDGAVKQGFNAVVLYNPGTGRSGGLNNRSAAEVGNEVAALARKLLASYPMREIVVGNEPWFNGDIAPTFAAKYAAAKQACAGLPVTLLASTTGDYFTGSVWSKDGADGGWTRDFLRALPSGMLPDAWTVQPYPPGSVVTANNHEHSGWPAVADWHNIAVSMGSQAPWYVTEIGLKISEKGSEQAQADGLKQLVNSLVTADPTIPGTPYDFIQFFAWYQAVDDSSGDWGLFDADGTPRPAFDVLKAAAA